MGRSGGKMKVFVRHYGFVMQGDKCWRMSFVAMDDVKECGECDELVASGMVF